MLYSKNIIRNFIPIVKMFWLSGTADRAITYIRSVELNDNREHGKNKKKEIPLLINFVSLIIVHYSYRSSLATPDTCRKIICFPI